MHVIVVDSRPKYKGKISLEQLLKNDINCSYVMINAVSFVMPKVTKVILGAQALLANGYVMGSIGSSQIALVAKSSNVPVVGMYLYSIFLFKFKIKITKITILVCCETYKFCDKVQTDALVNNELGNPLDLLKTSSRNNIEEVSPLADWSSDNKKYSNLTILNLSYDVTPPDLISCVVTDMGMLPCTSVPVVLRLKNRDVLSKKSQQSTSDAKVN
jgi:translation initiation factor eIF-2B subunit delta